MTDTFPRGSSVLIAFIGGPGWRATVIESDAGNPVFRTLIVRTAEGRTWGFYRYAGAWYSVLGRRKVLIAAIEGARVATA